jgi:cellulose biosynthesis protein BcsQ
MLKNAFPEKVLPVIPINIDVPEAFSRRLPVHRFNPDAPATKAYAQVTREVIRRGKEEKAPA